MAPSHPDMGVPDALGNAFTLPGTRRPIPADFGGTPQEPNGFGNADPFMDLQGGPPRPYVVPRGMMPPPYPGMQRPMAVNPLMSVPPTPVASNRSAVPSETTGVPQLLATLKDSLYPSQREMAVEQLRERNWRMQPQVVESLTKSARDDPAATVRAACVRALGYMKVNTPDVAALVQGLKNDRDARVRHEAEQALDALGVAKGQPFAPDGAMQNLLADAAHTVQRHLIDEEMHEGERFWPDARWRTPSAVAATTGFSFVTEDGLAQRLAAGARPSAEELLTPPEEYARRVADLVETVLAR